MNILEAMNDELIFAKTFKRRLLRGDSWATWKVFLTALFALAMDAETLETYRQYTGRDVAPTEPFREAYAICGRRSGKSLIAAMLGIFVACFKDYSPFLAPGEIGVLPIIAPDRKQCRIILGYVNGFFDASPTLASMVKTRLKESIELTNKIRIEVHTASFRTVRGYTAIGCIVDEVAFLRDEASANPDTELVAAIMPAMSTIEGALFLGISSPYARRGILWETFKEHFGKSDSPILVWQAETRAMNPTVSRIVIETAYLRDRAAASAEYGAQFRTDIESFLDVEIIEACVVVGRHELPFNSSHTYIGFCDPSGGRADSFSMAVAHMEGSKAVLDLVREVIPPFSPESVCQEFAATLRSYRISEVVGDKYAGEFPREQFRKHGIEYRVAEKSRSELYLELLPVVTSGQCELLDNARLTTQLCSLERRTGRGRDSVDHAPGSHDDLANAAAGALVLALAGATEHVYGLLTIYERVKSGDLVVSRGHVIERGEQEISRATWEEPKPPSCAKCGSGCVVRIGGVGTRCNQCGHTDPTGLPELQQITRGDILAGRKFQSRMRRFR